MKGHGHHTAHHAAHGHGHQGGHHQGHHGHQGHQAHGPVVVVKKHGGEVEHHKKRAMGGRTEPSEGKRPMEDERTKEMEEEEKRGEKRGGRMKHGGGVMGHHPKHRADKRARGGRMTPHEPLSGADGPNLPYARSHLPKPGTDGKGSEPRP